MVNNDYVFFMVYGVLLISSIYILIKELYSKEQDMYYEVLESNKELIEALKNQNKEIDELLQHNKGTRHNTTKEQSESPREKSILFV